MTDILNLNEMFKFWGVRSRDHEKLLSFLIQSYEELDEFMNYFYNGDIIRNMIAYQKYKRGENSISLDEFSHEYKRNKKAALERLFQEPLSDSCVNLMFKYNVTHVDLYCKFNRLPNESYLGVVKGVDFPEVGYSDDFLIET